MKPARLIVVPGNPRAKSKKQRNTRIFLPSGHEIEGIDALSVEAYATSIGLVEFGTVVQTGRVSRVTLEFKDVEVVTQLRAPKKQ